MRVLGIDPGLADTGWALLSNGSATGARLLHSGVIRTKPPAALSERLLEIYSRLRAVLESHRPDSVALEEMFFLKAAHTVRASLQARGVILLAAAQSSLPVAEYNPRQVKSTLTGSGSAQKSQMQRMIQRMLDLRSPLSPDDTADAAAIALCHLRNSRFKRLRVIEALGMRARPVPARMAAPEASNRCA